RSQIQAMPTFQNSPSYPKVDKVPDDILLEIFHHLLGPPGAAIRESDTWLPVTLSHVCSNWRCLALASPRLWTNIFLSSFSDPAILHQYLTRSRDALLRVDIAAPIKSTICMDLLAQTLSTQTHRLVSFHLYDVNVKSAMRLSSFFTSPAPQLRSLHIMPYNETWAWSDTVFDGQMPLLSDLDVSTRYGNLLARENLTRLLIDVEYPGAEELVSLLRACPTLESLDLAF
ncbi:hypothetical protein B0H21DRAFT_658938, partial [Amylocystis lapponica]